MNFSYEDFQPVLTINSEDIVSATSDIYDSSSLWTKATISDPFLEEVRIIIDEKLEKYSNAIYDVLKELGRIEIARDEWLTLITDKIKEQE